MADKNKQINTKVLPGFMELLPNEQILFDQMKQIIKETYQSFGFVSLDTPIIERSEVLLAKAGGETEKQIYRFSKGDNDLSLRFDLTIPLARYVSEHYNDLNFPFKRCHIAKVFRGERAQKGRYREFYQCDIDIIGREELSLVNDAEILAVIYQVFKNLNLPPFIIKISNRKLIEGLIESLGLNQKSLEIMRIIDKVEKISQSDFKTALLDLGLSDQNLDLIIKFINIKGEPVLVLKELDNLNINNEVFKQGLVELTTVLNYIKLFQLPSESYGIDLSIARGLDYYTGTIYETFFLDYSDLGSICSGGRYDNLAEAYTKKRLPGVGISIGLTRLFSQLRDLEIVKPQKSTISKVLILPFAEEMFASAIKISNVLRSAGVFNEVYFENDKIKNKITYANKIGVDFVVIIGEEELKNNNFTLKNMKSGEQISLGIEDLVKYFK
ncbi:MAG: histidine--tRNA ligase [Patescibacteria group bacterium]|jgi:histidyl-tRNA synthetase